MNEQMLTMLCRMAGIEPEKALAMVNTIGEFVQGLSPALTMIGEKQDQIINQNAEILELMRAQHDDKHNRPNGRRKLAAPNGSAGHTDAS